MDPIAVFKDAFREHPISMVGGSWLALVGGTLFVVNKKKIPFQLKVIQSRIVAQGALLGACVRALAARRARAAPNAAPPLLTPLYYSASRLPAPPCRAWRPSTALRPRPKSPKRQASATR